MTPKAGRTEKKMRTLPSKKVDTKKASAVKGGQIAAKTTAPDGKTMAVDDWHSQG